MRTGRFILSLGLAAQVACSGVIDANRDRGGAAADPGQVGASGGNNQPPSGAPNPSMPGAAPMTSDMPIPTTPGRQAEGGLALRPLRRLTRFEYDNTVRDLLGDTSRPASAFPDDNEAEHGFEVAAAVSPLDATVLGEVAERLAADAVRKNFARIVPCKTTDDACAKQFIATFGRRAFRRPLLADERAALESLYANARGQLGYDFPQSIRVVLTAILQSPEFLYHWELGAQAPTLAGKAIELTPYEIGARLAYFLTGTTPDDELLAAAESGALKTADGIAGQARRLLGSARAKEGVGEFFRQWWDLDRVRRTDKGANLGGTWDPLKTPMRQETQRFIEAVVLEGDGTAKTLLAAPFTYVNSTTLAKHYGVTLPAPATGTTIPMQKIDLNPAERAGFLTQGSFLAAQAAPTETSPVKRGLLVSTRIMCLKVPDPPAEVPSLPAAGGELKTMRQRATQHMSNPACATCHKMLDPIGFAFETYDTLGRYRTADKDQPIDATGTVSVGGATKTFKDGVELAQLLGAAPEVQACVAKQFLRYALGRGEVMDDEASLGPVTQALARGSVRDLLVALAQSKAFTQRAPAAGEVLP